MPGKCLTAPTEVSLSGTVVTPNLCVPIIPAARPGERQHNSIDFPRHASAQFGGNELCFLNVIPPAASLSSLIRLKGNSR